MLPVSVELVCWHRLEIFLLAECHKAWNVYLKSVFAISGRALLTHILSALSMYLKSVDINRRFIDSYRPPPRGPGWGTSASRPRRLTSTPGWGRGSSTSSGISSTSENPRQSREWNRRWNGRVYQARGLPGTAATIWRPHRIRRNQERRTGGSCWGRHRNIWPHSRIAWKDWTEVQSQCWCVECFERSVLAVKSDHKVKVNRRKKLNYSVISLTENICCFQSRDSQG